MTTRRTVGLPVYTSRLAVEVTIAHFGRLRLPMPVKAIQAGAFFATLVLLVGATWALGGLPNPFFVFPIYVGLPLAAAKLAARPLDQTDGLPPLVWAKAQLRYLLVEPRRWACFEPLREPARLRFHVVTWLRRQPATRPSTSPRWALDTAARRLPLPDVSRLRFDTVTGRTRLADVGEASASRTPTAIARDGGWTPVLEPIPTGDSAMTPQRSAGPRRRPRHAWSPARFLLAYYVAVVAVVGGALFGALYAVTTGRV